MTAPLIAPAGEPADSCPWLPRIQSTLTSWRPRSIPGANLMNRAAVAGILRQPRRGDTELLFIRRADNPRDPWSGHMAFPGGRKEPDDPSLIATAERETREEIGLDLTTAGQTIGRMSEVIASARGRRLPLVITPYYYQLTQEPELTLNEEVAEVIWVPVPWLADTRNRGEMTWSMGGVPIPLPCYRYEGRVIWGLTLKMLDELLEAIRRNS